MIRNLELQAFMFALDRDRFNFENLDSNLKLYIPDSFKHFSIF